MEAKASMEIILEPKAIEAVSYDENSCRNSYGLSKTTFPIRIWM